MTRFAARPASAALLASVALLASAALLLAACGGDGDKDPADAGGITTGREALERREDDLRDTAEDAINAFLDGDADAFYAHFSANFQARCDIQEFRGIIALAALFIGDLSDHDANVEFTEVRFEDDRAFVTAKVDIEGLDIEGEDEEGNFTDFWVLEDGEWKADTDDPNPCDLGEGIFGDDIADDGDDDGDDDAPSGPGASRSEAVALGEAVTTGDLRVTVLDVNNDAADEVLATDEFVDPPAAGYRYVLITVRAEHIGEGEETISISSSSFELTGARNVVYDAFNDESDCDFFFGDISGEMFPGGSLEGDLCFQVPQDEDGLILIVAPFFSFDDGDRRFLRLD